MSGLEGIVVTQLHAGEADYAAQPLLDFLAAAPDSVHPDTALMIRAAAELDDPEHARQLIDDIENSGRLNHLGGQAIITAHDLSSREHGGIVGMGTFQRLNEANILIEGLLVRPSHRGRHIGPAILHAAITDLVIAPEDSFTVDLPERDLRTRRFFERIGFIGDGDPHRHPEGSRGDVISHREYSGQVPFVGASVRALLGL